MLLGQPAVFRSNCALHCAMCHVLARRMVTHALIIYQ